MTRLSRRLLTAFVFASLAVPAVAQNGPPALPVSVAKAVKRQVVDWAEFPGRFEAANFVEVRAQVAGELDSVHFTDGQDVAAGQLLFKIDPAQFTATLQAAEAAVKGNETRLDLATSELKRAQDLRTTGNIPESTFQQRQQTFLEAQANLEASRAELETARLNLGYTQIKAPIAGRIGRKLVTEGNLIASGTSGTLLTTIVQFDPVYFYFDIDEQSLLSYQRNLGGFGQNGNNVAYLALSDETDFRREATINFLANQVDPETGTLRVRATLPNSDLFVTPGLFGRVRLATRPAYEALVLPDEAITLDQTRHLVMTVDGEGTVVPKQIQVGPRAGRFRVVLSGLTENDTVIVNGLMRARPGSKVTPNTVEIDVPADLTRPVATN